MKSKTYKIIVLGWLLCFFDTKTATAQVETWDHRFGFLTVIGVKNYSSPNPVKYPEDAHLTKEMLYKITYKDLVKINDINYRGGIKATLNFGGGVRVRVYLYDPSKTDGKGPIIFGCSRGIYDDGSGDGYVAPDDINMRSTDISAEGAVNLRPPVKPGTWRSDNMKGLFAAWAESYGQNVDGNPNYYNPFNNLMNAYVNVVIELTVKDATVNYIRIPGLRTFGPFDLVFRPQKKITDVQTVFNDPNGYPNWLFVMGHRGYFRDVPENSQEAMRLVVASEIPALEIDVQMTKDNVWVLCHDVAIGSTRRTKMPERLKTHPTYITKGEIPVSELTLCELRPDLCPSGSGHFAWDLPDQYEPVWLTQPEGDGKVPIATLGELLLLAKNKVLVNVDKVDLGNTNIKTRFDIIYNLMKKTGMENNMIVKGTNWTDPNMLKTAFPTVNWNELWYTPTYFWDRLSTNLNTNKAIVDAWANPSSGVNAPGIELIYMQKDDPAYQLIDYVKSKNLQVIQFPMWPEYCGHLYADGRTDHRNSWNWLLDKNSVKRPTCIITDRLEVLIDLLKASGLQEAGSLGW